VPVASVEDASDLLFRRHVPGYSVVEPLDFVPRTVRGAPNDINGYSMRHVGRTGFRDPLGQTKDCLVTSETTRMPTSPLIKSAHVTGLDYLTEGIVSLSTSTRRCDLFDYPK
jgi:hypothetical protein